MKYVSVRCKDGCDRLGELMQELIGQVIFVDVDNTGITGAAVGYDGKFDFEVFDKDLCVASTEEVVKSIRRKCRLDMTGLGDMVARVTGFLGIKPCNGCRKRQKKLNELIPFR